MRQVYVISGRVTVSSSFSSHYPIMDGKLFIDIFNIDSSRISIINLIKSSWKIFSKVVNILFTFENSANSLSWVLQLSRIRASMFAVEHVIWSVLLVFNYLHLPLQSRVEVVLNVVIGSARKEFCNFRPPISKFLVGLNYEKIFFFSPLVLFNIWV